MSAADSSSSTSSVSDGQPETWDDWTEEPLAAKSLFDDSTHPSPQAALQHDKQTHGVDLLLLASTLDFFERIRLINWIRSTKPDPKTLVRLDRSSAFLEDDAFLKPVVEDDALLQLDFDALSLSEPSPSSSSAPAASSSHPTASESDIIQALRAQLADSNQALDQLKNIIKDRLGETMGLSSAKEMQEEVVVKKDTKGKGVEGEERDDDSHYFESYAYNEIHEIMLKDKIRTNAYRDFILSNPAIFKDAVVLDVGCGSGILSMFAAQSGAKKVYAVDASAVAFKAERNIKANGLSDIITVVKGKVENIELPEKVDVIVSEWMGYFLLYECMLDSVLHARERFMKPTGLMVPSQTSIILTLFSGASLINDRIAFWEDVYGYKMAAMKEEIYDDALIDVVNGGDIVSDEYSLSDIVTQTVTVPELSFTTPFTLTATTSTTVNAFLGHFDTFFTTDGRLASAALGPKDLKETEIFFTTGAKGTPTHWKQTVFLLREPFEVAEGTTVSGSFTCSKNPENSRELVVEMTWSIQAKGAEKDGEVKAQVWKVR
ncbi:S-adenosyl-L-methionine-dependent methyltransferase [Leucosporidium creatinivorum]|uniref:type I protein arginine methyltransferase n=1 Tax=Leucosporidium creatinivorum TaxID=106004 RepID=A0A1Y2FK42_9BASI|nr:S-adenosyl-L-methionine-dependent methyltransferase [Leucosporidium creatinivorum]